jgi:ATP-binding cassette, subfamily F, member 2
MPSDRKKSKAGAKGKAGPKGKDKAADDGLDGITNGVNELAVDTGRSCTGINAGHPLSRDIHIDSFTLLYHGHELLVDSKLQLNYGR